MKNEAIEVLMNRRAIRQYKSEQITDEELKVVLDAGTYAPTAAGKQSPVIVAVQEPETRALLAKLNARVGGRDGDPYYGAPTVVLVLAPADFDPGELDGAAVLTNMANTAYAAGLGSCWIHRGRQMFEYPEGQALLEQWGLAGYVGIDSLALGYPACEHPVPKPRKENYYRVIK